MGDFEKSYQYYSAEAFAVPYSFPKPIRQQFGNKQMLESLPD
jgi:hypothetical protein